MLLLWKLEFNAVSIKMAFAGLQVTPEKHIKGDVRHGCAVAATRPSRMNYDATFMTNDIR